MDLLAQARDVHSQSGEDGIIAAILERVGARDRWCVEFGAWDGQYLSNTCRLIDQDGYSAILIEADARCFQQLLANRAGNERVICLHSLVGCTPSDGLDALLAATPIPRDFDLLSIDIDGMDIHVWRAVEQYRPKLVVIEFNPTIPTAVSFEQPLDPNVKWGSGLRALFEVAREKGYRLVCANGWNGFFVAEEHWNGEFAASAEELPSFRLIEEAPAYVFGGFDGTVLLAGKSSLVWHGIPIGQDDLQILPRLLRTYPDAYRWHQRIAYGFWRRFYRKGKQAGASPP
jgi:hypothetical protein